MTRPGNRMQGFSLALQSAAAGLLLVYISLLSFTIFGAHISLIFLPLLALYFWQYEAHYGLSLALMAGLGLWQDLTSGGPLGLWMLTYALIFTIINPTGYKAKPQFGLHWWYFVCLVIATGALISLIGAVALGQWPAFWAMVFDGLAATALFPFAYWLRGLFIQVAIDNDRSWSS